MGRGAGGSIYQRIGRGDWDDGASAFPIAPGDGTRTARRLVLPAPAYFVFFRELSEGGIGVITVLHGSMDVPSRLKEDAERISNHGDNE